MKRAAHLRTVEWHEPAHHPDRSPTFDDAQRDAASVDAASFDDGADGFGDDEPGSGVHELKTQPLPPSEPSAVEPTDERLTQVGPYRLIERIGSGAMGHVYRAEHTLLGRVVAIKMLRPELTSDEACVRRFLAEARAVNLIKHEHIIDVTDFACTPNGQPWFVMEMLEGSDLSAAATHEPLTLKRTLEITRQLCEALAAVHTAGIVHRDVKPENVFLAQREGNDYVTVLDFGIARLPDPTSADPLQEGLMGTPYYMAPEQISASPIDHRADLYAVGSLLFELIAGIGNTPFRSMTLQKQLMDVLMQPPPQLSSRAQMPELVRDDLDALVARCLAKQPGDRPASAREIVQELERITAKLEAPPVLALVEPLPSETATLILRGNDAASTAPIEVVETRKRARRELRARRAWSSRGVTVLSAAAAAAAMWVATSETSWAHALSRVTGWGDAVGLESGHVVQPAVAAALPPSFDDAYAITHVAQPTGGVGATAPLLVNTAPSAEPAAVEADDTAVDENGTPDDQLDQTAREERRARRAARAKARAEREQEQVVEQPELVISAATTEEAQEPNTYDRDLVLNPFSE